MADVNPPRGLSAEEAAEALERLGPEMAAMRADVEAADREDAARAERDGDDE